MPDESEIERLKAENAPLQTALVNAEARCDHLAARGVRMDDELVATRKNARWAEDALEKAKAEWRAAEQRAEAAEKERDEARGFLSAAQAERDRWRERYGEAADHLHDIAARPREALERARKWRGECDHEYEGGRRSEEYELIDDLLAEFDGARWVATGFVNQVMNERAAAEQRAEAAEKAKTTADMGAFAQAGMAADYRDKLAAAEQRNTELEGALRSVKNLTHLQHEDRKTVRWVGEQVGRIVDAALHDEERSAPPPEMVGYACAVRYCSGSVQNSGDYCARHLGAAQGEEK